MPLPLLTDRTNDGSRPERDIENLVAYFTEPVLVRSKDLDRSKRRACMTHEGIALMLQRWVHHNSREIIPKWRYEHVTRIAYKETDGIEDWCEVRGPDIGVAAAELEAEEWLDAPDEYETPHRSMIDVEHIRASFRKIMRKSRRCPP